MSDKCQRRVWLSNVIQWSSLHHLEALSPERTRTLLRRGHDVNMMPTEGDRVSPICRAHLLLNGDIQANTESARLVLLAVTPWSVETHELFPDPDRMQAVMLTKSLYHVYMHMRRFGRGWNGVSLCSPICSVSLFDVTSQET